MCFVGIWEGTRQYSSSFKVMWRVATANIDELRAKVNTVNAKNEDAEKERNEKAS